MADLNPKAMLNRAVVLLAGPFLLGQRALGLLFLSRKGDPPEALPKNAASRITVTPPEHAIKRRG
jgi:hypothetical protein